MSSWRKCNRDWLQSTGMLTKMTYKALHDAGCAEKSLIKAKKWPSLSCECSVILLVNIISMLENLSNSAKGSRQNCSPCFLVEASFVIQCDSLHAINQQLSHWTSIFVTVCLWVQSVFTAVVRFIWSESVDGLRLICIFLLVQFGFTQTKSQVNQNVSTNSCGSCLSVHWSGARRSDLLPFSCLLSILNTWWIVCVYFFSCTLVCPKIKKTMYLDSYLCHS